MSSHKRSNTPRTEAQFKALFMKIAQNKERGEKTMLGLAGYNHADRMCYANAIKSFNYLSIPAIDISAETIVEMVRQKHICDDYIHYAYVNSKQRRATSTTIRRFSAFVNRSKFTRKPQSQQKTTRRPKSPKVHKIQRVSPLPVDPSRVFRQGVAYQSHVRQTTETIPAVPALVPLSDSRKTQTQLINNTFDCLPTAQNIQTSNFKKLTPIQNKRKLKRKKNRNENSSSANYTNSKKPLNRLTVESLQQHNKHNKNTNVSCNITKSKTERKRTRSSAFQNSDSNGTVSSNIFPSPYHHVSSISPHIASSITSNTYSFDAQAGIDPTEHKRNWLHHHTIYFNGNDLKLLSPIIINKLYNRIKGESFAASFRHNQDDCDMDIMVSSLVRSEQSARSIISVLKETKTDEKLIKKGYDDEIKSFFKGRPSKRSKTNAGTSHATKYS